MYSKAAFYELVEQQCLCEDTSYVSYGIRMNGPSCCRVIEDIATDREQVSDLVDLFNANRLAPCQFNDAVEDFLETLK